MVRISTRRLKRIISESINKELGRNKRRGYLMERSFTGRNWMGIKGATFVDNGSWSDPEIHYNGAYYNYYDVWEGCKYMAQEDVPEEEQDDNWDFVDKWMEEHPDAVEGELMDLTPTETDEESEERQRRESPWMFDDDED